MRRLPGNKGRKAGQRARVQDDEAVSAIIEYLITFTIAFIIFTMLMAMFDGMFIRGPTDVVSQLQFTDVGNDVSAKLLDTYLIAPETGNVSTTFEMPDSIAGHDYKLNIRPSGNGWDKEVYVYSDYTSSSSTVTINGVNSTIPINGSTTSMHTAHKIKYDS